MILRLCLNNTSCQLHKLLLVNCSIRLGQPQRAGMQRLSFIHCVPKKTSNFCRLLFTYQIACILDWQKQSYTDNEGYMFIMRNSVCYFSPINLHYPRLAPCSHVLLQQCANEFAVLQKVPFCVTANAHKGVNVS